MDQNGQTGWSVDYFAMRRTSHPLSHQFQALEKLAEGFPSAYSSEYNLTVFHSLFIIEGELLFNNKYSVFCSRSWKNC